MKPISKPISQDDKVLSFLSWLVTNDFSEGMGAFAKPAEAMLVAGKSFKEIRKRADELLASMADKS